MMNRDDERLASPVCQRHFQFSQAAESGLRFAVGVLGESVISGYSQLLKRANERLAQVVMFSMTCTTHIGSRRHLGVCKQLFLIGILETPMDASA